MKIGHTSPDEFWGVGGGREGEGEGGEERRGGGGGELGEANESPLKGDKKQSNGKCTCIVHVSHTHTHTHVHSLSLSLSLSPSSHPLSPLSSHKTKGLFR